MKVNKKPSAAYKTSTMHPKDSFLAQVIRDTGLNCNLDERLGTLALDNIRTKLRHGAASSEEELFLNRYDSQDKNTNTNLTLNFL